MSLPTITPGPQCVRLRLVVRGTVQGVGFRPFVYRLATELGLCGWVNNSPRGVTIEVEGLRPELECFRSRFAAEQPPHCFLLSYEATWLDATGLKVFTIRDSETGNHKAALVLPDLATCPECLREILDPQNRRYQYPFTNCTHCGPRFSIITALPYDRANTSMRQFVMCPACQAEYDDPSDRRFHAQPNACPKCGPQLELWPGNARGLAPGESPRRLARGFDALLAAVHVIRCGHIVAVKGIGGFHLLADARNAAAVQRLRERKQREEKPFALMFPDLDYIKAVCEVTPQEERLLLSTAAPIVLLHQRADAGSSIAAEVAPGNPNLGVMLAANPLHHLLMRALQFPVVATSGNVSDEPICTDEFEAAKRLRGIADVLLVHDRPIVRHVDDSIVRVMAGREMMVRRARGFAPLPITFRPQANNAEARPILAVGAHLKNSVAFALGEHVFVSQHIGDLESERADHAFRRVATELPKLYDATPTALVADLHPDYVSTRFAWEATEKSSHSKMERPKLIQVQHHQAHALSCLAENEVALPALGVVWDGTGYGEDKAIWGGEFFRITPGQIERVGTLRPFPLPGGDIAIREPRRTALGLLYDLLGEGAFPKAEALLQDRFTSLELSALKGMLLRRLNTPWCSSAGRLFDAVAALLGLRSKSKFEGQAAMELEFAIGGLESSDAYPIAVCPGRPVAQLDWAPTIHTLLADLVEGADRRLMAAQFHNALAEGIVAMARESGLTRVALSGGCFQNRYLTERTISRLRQEGFMPYWHQWVPPNDGGIALGQVVAAWRELAQTTSLKQDGPGNLQPDVTDSAVSLDQANAIEPFHIPLVPTRKKPDSSVEFHAPL